MGRVELMTLVIWLTLLLVATPSSGQDAALQASWSGNLGVAPRLLGASTVFYNDALWVFGGKMPNETNPSGRTFRFDLSAGTWHLLSPAGEDRPIGRMFHSADLSSDGTTMVVYGGLNCFQETSTKTSQVGPVSYNFANSNIEYQLAMED